MKNLKLSIEYNGSRFCGWQRQKGKRTVQEEIETAFFTLTGEKVCVEGSGRTDKGVHALCQVASVKTQSGIPTKNFKYALNNLLPPDIRIKKVEKVSDDFHARFSTKRKTYQYLVCVGGEKSAIKNDVLGYYPYAVKLEKMISVCNFLVGKHNFKGFCSTNTQVTNFEREIFDIKISRKGRIFCFEVTGDGFLYNMVRIIVGTLLECGADRLDEKSVKLALETGERKYAGKTMSPNGLYLKKVEYK